MEHDAVAVVDFGGQYAHLIATKIRRHHVLAEIRQPEDPIEQFEPYKGIILSGSPSLSSHGEDSAYNKEIFDLPIPILGFCFGHQEIAKHYGGKVIHGGREWAHADMYINREHPLFKGLGRKETVWMSHFDSVTAVGPEFEELGYTMLGDSGLEESDLEESGREESGREESGRGGSGKKHAFAAIGSDSLKRYGFQFHPEVDDTEHGDEMIANFVLEICGCRPTWAMGDYIDEQLARIREQVDDGSVFLLASGGVDSTVAAKLFGMALGPDRLHLLHVDNGLMRKDESKGVLAMLEELGLDKNLHFVDASEDFLAALGATTEPEKKRHIIGTTFIEVFEREARRLGIEDHLLGQGTIYPDTIETGGTKRADTIKTHHNRVPIIDEMIAQGKVVEPLAELYKVEVRELGEKLKIPHDAVWRHPFPGPGLGVRLLCSDGKPVDTDLDALQERVEMAIAPFGLDARVLPIRSVGVKADLRSYEHPVLLSGEAPWEKLCEKAGTLFKEVEGINRCIWNLAPGLPTAFKPLPATMTRERLDLLREADHLVMEGLKRYGLYETIWQCPTVLVPLVIDHTGEELCIVRPVLSERAMTASAGRLPDALLDDLRKSILSLPKISGLAIDLTSKPPGTIEWE